MAQAKFDVVLQRDCPQIDPSAANGHHSNLHCGGFNTSAPTGELMPPSPEMAFGIATAANFKENTAVARLGYDNDAFMCDNFGDGTWVGDLGSRIWGQKMGPEGSRFAESERGVWLWLEKAQYLHTPF